MDISNPVFVYAIVMGLLFIVVLNKITYRINKEINQKKVQFMKDVIIVHAFLFVSNDIDLYIRLLQGDVDGHSISELESSVMFFGTMLADVLSDHDDLISPEYIDDIKSQINNYEGRDNIISAVNDILLNSSQRE